MLELPTIKTDFLFKNSQGFDQTTHARLQQPIVFIDIISLYFNCIGSVKYVFKRSHHGHVMLFPRYNPSGWWEKYLHAFWNADYFALFTFSHSKWQHMKVIRNAQMSKYFLCYIFGHFF